MLSQKTISQSIPNDWHDQSVQCVRTIRDTARVFKPEIVLNADQMFVNLYPDSDRVLAPSGSKRVGEPVKADKKKGITLMVRLTVYWYYHGVQMRNVLHLNRNNFLP